MRPFAPGPRQSPTRPELSSYIIRRPKTCLLTSFTTTQSLTEKQTMAGFLSYAACQTACNAAAVACYSAAGLTFGTVTGGVGAPAAAVACGNAQGICMASCVGASVVADVVTYTNPIGWIIAAGTAIAGGITLLRKK